MEDGDNGHRFLLVPKAVEEAHTSDHVFVMTHTQLMVGNHAMDQQQRLVPAIHSHAQQPLPPQQPPQQGQQLPPQSQQQPQQGQQLPPQGQQLPPQGQQLPPQGQQLLFQPQLMILYLQLLQLEMCCRQCFFFFSWYEGVKRYPCTKGMDCSGAEGWGCGTLPADIVFLLDSSGSVLSTNFQKMRDFVTKFTQSFPLGPSAVQIGVVTFSTTPTNVFNLNTYQNKTAMLNAINKIPYDGGGTRTDLALQYVMRNSFTKPAGDRDKVANILIVMTDGQSNNPPLTLVETQKLHQLNIKVFAIGIGTGVDKTELGHIASDAQHVFTVNDFNSLRLLNAELRKTACDVDGQWGNWGSYSPCTRSCGSGTQFRQRACDNPPPANGGKPCNGSAREDHQCNTQPCPTTPPPTTPPPTTHAVITTLTPGCNGTNPADILFILDASGSVGPQNFRRMLDFVTAMVNSLPVSPTETQVGMITYDSRTYPIFHLNKYTNKVDINAAIFGTRYSAGTTNTADAIKYARETAFTTQNGARSNAAKIAIVITDGESDNSQATLSEAQKLRDIGVTIFSIGVGSGPTMTELNAIATDPDSTHVLQVTNFDKLNLIKSTLTKKTCDVMASTPPPTEPSVKECHAQADIVFLLDSSGSVGADNFQKMLGFVKDVVNTFNIGLLDVQIGVDTFETNVKTQFTLNQYHDSNSIQAAVGKINYVPGYTHTGEALKYMREHSFSAAAGDRPDVPNIAIVVTDGQSNNHALTVSEAKLTQSSNITVLALGVGKAIDRAELGDIATNPDSQNVYTADSFDALKSLKDLLSTKACEASKVKDNITATAGPACSAKADIVFVLDSSGSIGSTNYQKMLEFVKNVVQKFDIGDDKIRVGTEIFSDRTYIQFQLNKYFDKAALENAITNIPYKRGTTNTGQALKDLYSSMFTAANGDRPGIPNIAIVVTDGQSTNHLATVNEAQSARNHGITVFAVGVGDGIDKNELGDIATDPDSTHVLTVQDFSKLVQIQATVASATCSGIPPSAATNLPTVATTEAPDPCHDQLSTCSLFEIPAVCSDFADWARDNCQRSCGFCTPAKSHVEPPCVNKIANCQNYGSDICTGTYKGWAQDNCRKFCGYCVGKCFYNGQTHNQGESWSDGCKYDCTCDDASRGMYSCYNKCPVYYNLPPQCTLVMDSNNCCLQPICNFKPTYSTTNGQSLGLLNGVNVCIYKGHKYYQGQTWQDGCDYNCVCQDGNIGMYTCASVCGSFSNLPSFCHLEKQPGKCCPEPQCDFSKQFGQFSGVGTVSGGGSEKCLYKGQPYSQGAIWDDGCDLECVCENAHVGFYRCHKKCPTYINLPLGCTESQVAGECCPTIKCNGFVGTFTGSQTQPGTIGGYPVPNAMPTAVPTPMPGQTFAPGMIPTAAPPLTAKTIDGCMYKGVLYNQGMRWNDGCDYSCMCEDESTGRFRCSAKCPSFQNLGSECQMKSNPSDPCCEYPECNPVNGSLTVVPVPTYGQGFSGYGKPSFPSGYGVMGPMGPSGQNPTPGATSGGFTGMVNPNPGQVITGSGHAGCVFHGVHYTMGQTWDDGCDYRCECLDDVSGSYRCSDRCPSYMNIPMQCQLKTDPMDSCCKTISCDNNQHITTLAPLFIQTTPYDNVPVGCQFVPDPKDPTCCRVPQCQVTGTTGTGVSGMGTSGTGQPQGFLGTITGYGRPQTIDSNSISHTGYATACLYKGHIYQQGQTWDDGCDYSCECVDASNGMYRCTQRCERIASVPQGCHFVVNPADTCCQKLMCDPTATQLGSCKDNINNCDQFMYACTGQYKDWATQNCAKSCHICDGGQQNVGTTSGPCIDKIPNCVQYGRSVCTGEFMSWAALNCPVFCNLCGGSGTGTGTGTGMTGGGTGTGTGTGMTGGGTGTGTGTGLTGGGTGTGGFTGFGHSGNTTCKDVLPNCPAYTMSSCLEPYVEWAKVNCPSFCGYCDQTGNQTFSGSGSGSGIIGQGIVTETYNSFTGFSGGCLFKGRYYLSGEKWKDGCQNCTCVNGQTGYYKCSTGCPTYTSLPNGCVLKTPVGECCAKPDCSGTGSGTGTGMIGTGSGNGTSGTGISGTGTGCFYGNVVYQQGQTWKDGCKFRCTCSDGQTGQYTCQDFCLKWNLPAACTLQDPAAGKCCPTPKCPDGFVISYPPGYTPE
ncbi:hypothetical protein ACJMK2_009345 [Sinanodonta woodiana]|uniref:Uncharacterized protein n=1 Tax=Sinanodonta woodiana TaxID=1069815 RepID=A0ABD3VDN0_SINWO